MIHLFQAYLEAPSAASFSELRNAVITHPDYEPYGDALSDLNGQLDGGHFEEAGANTDINLLLSPRAHLLKSFAWHKCGHEDGERAEQFLYRMMLDGIRGTGDGSREQPYLVSSVADEHDLLQALGEELDTQDLLEESGRRLDHVVTKSGAEWYFDVTDVLAQLERARS
ncbi:MAG: hypothetical protein EOO11_22745 [Chitinophagaceae bacterium]|nr:MAG: hypothetical protein EOO11_22745 [Chitinophagaceae bacterium]